MPRLSDKQRRFAEIYVSTGFDRMQAIRGAGYSEKTGDSIASKLLKKSQIVAEVERLLSQNKEIQTVEIGEIIAELRRIGLGRQTDRISNSDRLRALELLGKTKGIFKDSMITEIIPPEITEAEAEKLRELARQHNIQIARAI